MFLEGILLSDCSMTGLAVAMPWQL